ncbi:MAG: hydrogenase maturation protease [Chloroflexota bacterium]
MRSHLKRRLAEAQARAGDRPARLAIVGIGNELGGDDAAGMALALALKPRLAHLEAVRVYPAGPAPESFTGPLRRFAPDLALLVDAAQLDLPPGGLACLDWEETSGLSACTHCLPLHVFCGYLAAEVGCRVAVVGIQPGVLGLGMGLSPAVQAGVEELEGMLVEELGRARRQVGARRAPLRGEWG